MTEKEPNEFAPAFDVAAGALLLCGCLCTSLWVNNKTKVNREDEENEEVVICDENRSFEEGHEEGEDGEDVEEATKTPPQRTLRTRTRRKG